MRLLVAALLIVIGGVAEARMKAGPVVMSAHVRVWIGGGGGTVIDTQTPLQMHSFRKLQAGYAGQSIRLRRASDNAQQDVGFVGSDFDTASATTFCNATTCFVAKWYDQSGNVRDFTQVTAANQPTFAFGCTPSGGPCMRLTATAPTMSAPTATPAGASVSFSTVTRRTSGTGACILLTENANLNRFMFNSAAGSYFLAATGSMTALQTEGNWHAAVGVINGASSYIAVDAAVTTGTVTINSSAASPNITGSASTTCDEVEAIIWDNFAVSQSQATTLTASQKTYWGF